MTGPHDSVIGVERSAVLQRFLTGLPQRFETATENPRLNAVLIDADETTGRATRIEAMGLSLGEIDALAASAAVVR
jgi:calcineurin-like phosphoesterase